MIFLFNKKNIAGLTERLERLFNVMSEQQLVEYIDNNIEDKKLDLAYRAADYGLRRFPESAQVHCALGLVLLARGNKADIPEALSLFDSSIEIFPYYKAYANRAIAYSILNEKKYAEQIYADLLTAYELEPHDPINACNLSMIYLQRKEFNAAVRMMEKVTQAYPEVGQFEEMYQEVFSRYADSSAVFNNHYSGAEKELNNDLKKALSFYNKVLAEKPDFIPTLLNRGGVFLKLGQIENAEKDFYTVLELDPQETFGLLNLATVHMLREENDRAIVLISKAIELDQYYAPAFLKLGQVYEKMNEIEKARNAYRNGLALRSNELIKLILKRLLAKLE